MGPGFESLKVHHGEGAEPIRVICSVKLKHAVTSKLRFELDMTEVSVPNAEGPPVPIPNTEVKLCSAENTCLETSREDRSMLTQ